MQSLLKKVIWACLLIVPFVVLYVASGNALDIINWGTSGFYFPFISGKNLLFRFLVEIAFFSWVALALANPQYRIAIRKSPLLITYGVFMIVLLVADVFGLDPMKSFWSNFERMEGYSAHLHFFAYFIVLSAMLQTAEHYKRMFNYLVASNIAVLIVGYGQLLGANGYIFSKLLPSVAAKFSQLFPIHMSENRLDATLGNSAYFAIYCLIFIFILGLMWSQHKEPRTARLYPVLMVLNLVALFYTGTRGTQIGLFVGALVMLGVLVFRWTDSKKELLVATISSFAYMAYMAYSLFIENGLLSYFSQISYAYAAILLASTVSVLLRTKEPFRKAGAGIFIGIVTAVLLFQSVKHTSFVQNSPTLARLASISPNDLTGMSRLTIWKVSLEAFKERPVLGYGQENFSDIYASKFVPDKMWRLESWYDRSHNVFFDWLVAAGALGLLSYLSLYAVALWVMWRKRSEMPFMERAIVTGALAGYFVHNIFVFDNLISYSIFFLLLAYIAFRSGSRGGLEYGKKIEDDQLQTIYIPAAVVLLIVSAYLFVYKPVMVNKNMVRGLDIGRHMQTMPFPEVVRLTKQSFERAIAYNTLGSEEALEQYQMTATRLLSITVPENISAEDRKLTLDALRELSEGVNRHIERSFERYKDDVRMLSIYGAYYNSAGYGVAAEQPLSIAHSLAPKKQLVSFELVRSYLLQEKFNEAYALAEETYDLAPEYPDALKVYLMAAAYAKQFSEASARLTLEKKITPFDPDVLSALVQTNQIQLAIVYLNELKKASPEYASQVDEYIRQLLAEPKK
jgi:O-antigen ligase